ncbi:YggU family protein [candidate division WOR-3 bacterium]|nr:YggU family protein [candidate division WOR-3 bacterium]
MNKKQVIQVRVVPNARKNEVKEEDGIRLRRIKVWLTAPPVEGKANKLLIKVLAKHFDIKKSNIKIIKGEKSRDKVVQIVK